MRVGNKKAASLGKISTIVRCRLTPVAMVLTLLGHGLLFHAGNAAAQNQRIENAVAVFSALDKVTATIEKLEIPIGETMQFAALKVTPRVCLSSPPTEQPKTTTFVQVDETQLDGSENRIFSGWMFAESPGLNAVEHPVFDVWLTGCKGPATRSATNRAEGQENAENAGERRAPPPRRRRIRR